MIVDTNKNIKDENRIDEIIMIDNKDSLKEFAILPLEELK
tara:strand:+ start:1065 stop:1184 length:120 start_codon:yes stop_codon:yes gene_type:complete